MFDQDIRGEAWSTCDLCSHPTPQSCSSRRVAGLCDELARDPASWSPLVAAMPPEDRPPVDRDCTQIEAAPPPDESEWPPGDFWVRPGDPPAPAFVYTPPDSLMESPTAPGQISTYLAEIEAAKSCPSRGPVASCGCTEKRVCLAGKGYPSIHDPGESLVTLGDCIRCPETKSRLAGKNDLASEVL